MATPARKADHLTIAAGEGVVHRVSSGLEEVRLRHRALPSRDLDDVSLEVSLLGVRLGAPLVVSAMTGGTAEAGEVNDRLARAAAEHGVGMVLGSGRALLDDPDLLRTYRGASRPPLLLANLGTSGLTPERAARLVELLGADGLSIHLNPIQEAIQPEGDVGEIAVRQCAVAEADLLETGRHVMDDAVAGGDLQVVGLTGRGRHRVVSPYAPAPRLGYWMARKAPSSSLRLCSPGSYELRTTEMRVTPLRRAAATRQRPASSVQPVLIPRIPG